MKRIARNVVMLIAVFILSFSLRSYAEEEQEREIIVSGDYAYILLDDGVAEIVKYRSNKENVEVPESLDDHAVTSIGDWAFSGCESLISITLPDSVTSIGVNPFFVCGNLEEIRVSPGNPSLAVVDGLLYYKPEKRLVYCPMFQESIDIPQGIKTIGDEAFSGCGSLSGIRLPDSVTSIGDRAFSDCGSLSSITLPDSVTSIGVEAFFGCGSLSSITLPDSVTSIGDRVFSGCGSLSSITLPDSVTSIGVNPFYGCGDLEEIRVSPGNPSLAVVDGLLYYKPEKRLVYCPMFQESIDIPQGIKTIGDEAFSGCGSLSSIRLPDSVTSIGDGAFYYCTSLRSITVLDGVTIIGDRAFSGCCSLSSITLPDSVTSIGKYAFSECDKLTVTVYRDSYAKEYCETNGIQYTYPDSLDWLND